MLTLLLTPLTNTNMIQEEGFHDGQVRNLPGVWFAPPTPYRAPPSTQVSVVLVQIDDSEALNAFDFALHMLCVWVCGAMILGAMRSISSQVPMNGAWRSTGARSP